MILHKLAQSALAMELPLRCAEDVIAVRQQTRDISWRVGGDIEDVPDVGDDRERCPL
jgi:hypothetical protein